MGSTSVHARLRLWIWLFRLHLFGHIVAVMAFVALAVSLSGLSGAPLVAPAVAVLCVGLIVIAFAAAFYYHFAAWGALDMEGKEDEAVRSLVRSLRVPTEYVTCLTRVGRVFFGFGQVVLAVGVLGSTLLPLWLVTAGATLGVAAMTVTMALPDKLEYYTPLFQLNAVWLAGMGW